MATKRQLTATLIVVLARLATAARAAARRKAAKSEGKSAAVGAT